MDGVVILKRGLSFFFFFFFFRSCIYIRAFTRNGQVGRKE